MDKKVASLKPILIKFMDAEIKRRNKKSKSFKAAMIFCAFAVMYFLIHGIIYLINRG